ARSTNSRSTPARVTPPPPATSPTKTEWLATLACAVCFYLAPAFGGASFRALISPLQVHPIPQRLAPKPALQVVDQQIRLSLPDALADPACMRCNKSIFERPQRAFRRPRLRR